MDSFSITKLLRSQDATNLRYLEVLRKASMSMGVYMLPKGAADPQKPHAEDEAYYVLGGYAEIRVGDEDRVVEPGDLVFVAKGVALHFHSISADLSLLVFFAPAESS